MVVRDVRKRQQFDIGSNLMAELKREGARLGIGIADMSELLNAYLGTVLAKMKEESESGRRLFWEMTIELEKQNRPK